MITIDVVKERLRSHHAARLEDRSLAHAAVAIVLRDSDIGAEFIVIHRSHRQGDPWSGHMALPGGRRQAEDRDLLMTVERETREEVGVNLEREGELLGRLDDLRAVGRGRLLDLVITPFVYAACGPIALTPDPTEVQSAFWISLATLRHDEARGVYRQRLNDQETEFPAFIYQGHTIWGLTHRILTGFLDVLG